MHELGNKHVTELSDEVLEWQPILIAETSKRVLMLSREVSTFPATFIACRPSSSPCSNLIVFCGVNFDKCCYPPVY